jgi:hypothetical protein
MFSVPPRFATLSCSTGVISRPEVSAGPVAPPPVDPVPPVVPLPPSSSSPPHAARNAAAAAVLPITASAWRRLRRFRVTLFQ